MTTPAHTTTNDQATLTAAHTYATAGLRVIPIRPGHKSPSLTAWVEHATLDPDTITAWWTGLYRGHGIGITLGHHPTWGHLFAIDIDQHDHDGEATWTDLLNTYPDHPPAPTWEAATGGGGRHLIYRAPTEIRNGRLAPGIDIRGAGGQILAEPTIHPNGTPYRWQPGHAPGDIEPAEAPGWILAMLDTPTPAPATSSSPPAALPAPTEPGDRPGDIWAATTTWHDILTPDGWTHARTDPAGTDYWTRPGKNPRDGISATTSYGTHDVLKIFTTSLSHIGLDPDNTYSKLGYLAATRHGGDHQAAARWLADNGYTNRTPTNQPGSSSNGLVWQPPPPTTPLTDQPEPEPLTIRWADTLNDPDGMPPEPPELVEGMLRQGEFCVIGAPRAIGKSWLAYNLATRLAQGTGHFIDRLPIRQAANVLILQGELDQWGSANRWHTLTGNNHPLPHVAETFERIKVRVIKKRINTPDGGTTEHYEGWTDPRLEQAITDHNINVVIIDPWASFFAGNENSNDETEAGLDQLRAITQTTGVAWVIIHHLRKTSDTFTGEPEDLWRGASRLADWASTRLTILPHYSEAARRAADLTRREARRYINLHWLRRSTPTDDFSAHLDPNGWWRQWDPTDDTDRNAAWQLAYQLDQDGGTWSSTRQAAKAMAMSSAGVEKLIRIAYDAGYIDYIDGPRGARGVQLIIDTTARPPRAPSRADEHPGHPTETTPPSTHRAPVDNQTDGSYPQFPTKQVDCAHDCAHTDCAHPHAQTKTTQNPRSETQTTTARTNDCAHPLAQTPKTGSDQPKHPTETTARDSPPTGEPPDRAVGGTPPPDHGII